MSFADTVRTLAERRGLALPSAQHPEPLAALDYAAELALKRDALAAFWQEQRLAGRPSRSLRPRSPADIARRPSAAPPSARRGWPSPSPDCRRPRAGSRRRPSIPRSTSRSTRSSPTACSRPPARALATALNWAIVRGTAGALSLVLNVRVFDARVVRAAKQLAEALQQEPLGVRAASLYLDPTGSDYYLEARRPTGTLSSKRLFGPDWLQVEVDGVRLRFPPTVFSQVNGAMLGAMTATAGALLAPLEGHALLDLYCGYGLFALTVGRAAAQVLGVDFDGPAIEAARGTAEHLGCAGRVRFLAGRIDGDFLADRVRPARGPEVVLLDPPRQGTAEGVAAALAERRPERVVHICCGTDEIPREVAAWSAAGYRVRRAVPLDLFPGTPNLETLLLLER